MHIEERGISVPVPAKMCMVKKPRGGLMVMGPRVKDFRELLYCMRAYSGRGWREQSKHGGRWEKRFRL